MVNKNLSVKSALQQIQNVMGKAVPHGGAADKKVRSFKICEINGKDVTHTGRYKSKTTPGVAAKKALKRICNDMNIKNKKCEVVFSIQEVTRGSDKKVFGSYVGVKKLLKNPKKVYDKNKKLLYVAEYESEVSLASDTK